MLCSLGISNFLEEISSLSHSIVFLYFLALITEEGFLISLCYSLELPGVSVVKKKIHLQTQRTRVGSLIQVDPTCQGATKPLCHNYGAYALEPGICNC